MSFEKLKEQIEKKKNPTVMGLDIDIDYIPESLKTGDIENDLVSYSSALIDACSDIIPAVKPNCAFFEQYGLAGMRALDRITKISREAGLCVILDAKRGDIGNTCNAYARAYLAGGEEKPDYLTVNPYMGSESVLPFAKEAEKTDKGIFVLARTSNPSAAEFEDIKDVQGVPLYMRVAEKINEWNAKTSCVGAVCGATHPAELAALRASMPGVFFLIPGYGAQGGGASDVAPGFENGKNAIVNASRSLIAAWKKKEDGQEHYKDAVREAALDMKAKLNSVM